MGRYDNKELSKEEWAEKGKQNWADLKAIANSPNASNYLKSVAIKEMERQRLKMDKKLQENNPKQYAANLRKNADYWDKKAKN